MKIGVFICHCGSNIAGTVDCGKVAEIARTYPDVAFSTDTMYTCSEPGQEEIVAAIKEHHLDGVVVASCTPRMHEPTFRRTVERAGLNKYMFEMANIREHVSWIGKDKEANTNKAAELVRIAVEKLRRNNPLFSKSFESTKRVLVIGGGVAGIQAALDCADAGLDVLLVERESHIGGKMAKLDKTFPTVDCSSCILGPKMVDVAQHPKITLMAASEVTNVAGYVGNFTVTVKKKATYVDWSKCTGCGACMDKCPAKKTPDKFNEFVGPTTAINIPFPQAIPKKATINPEFCRKLTSGKCGVCAKVCPTGAINYEMKDEEVTETVGAIVAATGYDLMDWTVYGQYGAGQYPDVITSLQYERIMSASGPTGGHIKRPSDGKEPKSVVFIQCVGSRDRSIGRPYCSGFCCMYTAKQAVLTKDHIPDSQSYVFYMDIRSNAKLYDEFTRRAMEEYGTQYIRDPARRPRPVHRARGGHPARQARRGEGRHGGPRRGHRRGQGREQARGNPAHLLRQLRFLHGIALQAAPRGDQHRRCLPRGRRPRPEGHPVLRRAGQRRRRQGHRPALETPPRKRPADFRRGHQALRRLRQVHQGVPLPGHRGKGNPGRKEGADHRGRVSGLRSVHRHLSAGRHSALSLHR